MFKQWYFIKRCTQHYSSEKCKKTMFFQEHITNFRGVSHVATETKNFNYFVKLLNKTY